MSRVVEGIEKIKKRMPENTIMFLILKGIFMGIMLIAIFLHLLNTELVSAPEFIYNQF